MSDLSRRPERCPECGYEGPRDGFEGWEGPPPMLFVARCPKCEVVHPDQTNTPIPTDDPPGALRSAWSAPCAQAGCDDVADHIAVQPHGLSMLFKGGAALLCPTHARQYRVYGALVLPLSEFADIAARTTRGHGGKLAAENRELAVETNRYRAALEDICEGIFSGNQAADWARRALKRGQMEKPAA